MSGGFVTCCQAVIINILDLVLAVSSSLTKRFVERTLSNMARQEPAVCVGEVGADIVDAFRVQQLLASCSVIGG